MSSCPRTREGQRPPGLWRVALPASALLAFMLWVQTVSAFEPTWVQNHQETQLWSGPDARAISFGRVAQWSRFLVVSPQLGARLYVFNPGSGGYAYIDAAAVGPVSPPPASGASAIAARTAPSLPSGYEPWWVANFVETELWSGSHGDATALGPVPQFRRFLVVEPQNGDRLRVWSPEADGFGYLDASTLGPSGPSVWMDARAPRLVRQVGQPARAVGDLAAVRNLPIYDDETELHRTPNNTPLDVRDEVQAADGSRWYTVGEGEYIRADEARLPRPVDRPRPGRWIDADLEEPTLVTAYERDRVIYSALAIKGRTATATPKGTFQILRRVENETMDSETIGIPRDSPDGYLLKDVLYTQYFTSDGASLHYNYWLGTFGRAGSHGCLGLNQEDSRWFWDWASLGTQVVIR